MRDLIIIIFILLGNMAISQERVPVTAKAFYLDEFKPDIGWDWVVTGSEHNNQMDSIRCLKVRFKGKSSYIPLPMERYEIERIIDFGVSSKVKGCYVDIETDANARKRIVFGLIHSGITGRENLLRLQEFNFND